MWCCGQIMAWRKSIKQLSSVFGSVNASCFPSWGPTDEACRCSAKSTGISDSNVVWPADGTLLLPPTPSSQKTNAAQRKNLQKVYGDNTKLPT